MNPLLKLIEYGQSYWIDNLTRKMIKTGELERRVKEEGLRGVTSNPSIFNNAISKSTDYDDQIGRLVQEGKSIHEIYEALVVKDVQDACDILRPVYEQSGGMDGFVSLEVSPYLGHDADGTKEEARRLSGAVNRPNCFIKIPGTRAGIPVIEEMLYEGININVTLLFSIRSYEAVANAYIRALERRVEEKQPIDNIASVASFFLSRIDVLVDQLLGHRIIPWKTRWGDVWPEALLGKAGIASAKLAYQSFKRIFSGEGWQKLAENGARLQRPLWASTSTKDPLYSDVRYVEPLIGPHTVNTMPGETIAAFADHGKLAENSIEQGLAEARRVFSDLEKVGIDIDFVTTQLVNEGIQKFIDPYNALMTTLAREREKFLEDKTGRQKIYFGDSESKVTAVFSSMDDKQFVRRLYNKDPRLWSSHPENFNAIRNRMGWLNSVSGFRERVSELTGFAQEIKDTGFKYVVLLGMGGSSLCPEVSRESFGSAPGYPQLLVLDNTAPEAVKSIEDQTDLSSTLFIVASKSGTTTETLSFYKYFYKKVEENGTGTAGNHFIAITDPGSPLVEVAGKKRFKRVFENPVDIGGRYSALSYFGLVPMALMGIDIEQLLENAHQMQHSCGPFIPSKTNPGAALGALLGQNQRSGRDKVTFILSQSIYAFGYWVEQLLAESTGKEGLGVLPVEGETLGSPRDYRSDRLFVYLRATDDDKQEAENKLKQLEEAGHPVARIEIKDRLALGGEYFRWEMATALAGTVMGINPFDEPNVAESKKNTRDLLAEWQKRGSFPEGRPLVSDNGLAVYGDEAAHWLFNGHRESLPDFLNQYLNLAKSPDYVALLGYFHRSPARHQALQSIRHALRERYQTATTLGYGPRYLHSTGQFHKGGPNRGVFIMLTADATGKISIPGETYDFATLQRAQALGDFRALNDKKRRVIRIHLGSDVDRGLSNLKKWMT